jgi:starch synthase (maltosyl-transferring)
MTALNRIRRGHPALSRLRSVHMWPSSNPQIFAYSKMNDTGTDRVLTVVNLDPHHVQEAVLFLDRTVLGLPPAQPLTVFDELSQETFTWFGDQPFIRLDPVHRMAHIFSINS